MRRSLALVLASVAVVAACADRAGDDGATRAGAGGSASPVASAPGGGDPAAGGISQADDDLQVTVDRGDGTPAQEWTLTCAGFVEGSHPEAEAACAHLAGLDAPFLGLPDDVICTEQFGGPQTAHVRGRWGGERVDLELARSNGCLIAQWDGLGPLLPIPVGAAPAG